MSTKKSTECAKVCLYAMPQKNGNTQETLSGRINIISCLKLYEKISYKPMKSDLGKFKLFSNCNTSNFNL
jgi:hypothetical protein